MTTTNKTLAGLLVEPVSEREHYINLLVYGEPGVGKTVLAGSASEVPNMAPVLFLDIEGGTMSLKNTFPDVDSVRVNSWAQVQGLYNELYDGKSGYKTVVIDSLSETQKFSMGEIMKSLIRSNPDRDPDVPGQYEWNKNSEQIRRLVRGFRDLPLNTIFTALVKEDKTRSGVMVKKPSLPGKLSGEVGGFLDFLLYMYIKRGGDNNGLLRLMLTQGTDTELAKDRSGKLPTVVESPTMSLLASYIYDQPKTKTPVEILQEDIANAS